MMALSDLHEQRQQQGWFETSSTGFPGAGPAGPGEFRPAPVLQSTAFGAQPTPGNPNFLDSFKNQLSEHAMQFVAQEALNQAKQKATGFTRYFSLDWLTGLFQPFFAVDGVTVIHRMKASLMPFPCAFVVQQPDFYGPLMIGFTLALFLILCVHHFGKDAAAVVLQQGTAIGTSLGLVEGYVLCATVTMFLVAFFTETQMTVPQIFCATGYAMTAHVVILAVAYVFHSSRMFWLLAATMGLSSGIALGRTFKEMTPEGKKGYFVAAVAFACHETFLIYLRYSFLKLP